MEEQKERQGTTLSWYKEEEWATLSTVRIAKLSFASSIFSSNCLFPLFQVKVLVEKSMVEGAVSQEALNAAAKVQCYLFCYLCVSIISWR
jgi:hypothetical protein